ncbi:hypothetical protein [Sutcliffiella horikoshii]|uniref:Uncharacterized protein n=1 Tax=Sutcliffiella horikoshii TaxID=79883 RepID=A0A5D4TDZ1_9BACI|nr:hypothetical protein [Sutcliffiella horikoshii]TYS72366.1 hypothetical protein FZC75_10450 [Sutcliffiella horikoshii]
MKSFLRLQDIRDRQEKRRQKGFLVPDDLMDVVDYAVIERDHAEYLRLMIEYSPYVLKMQYRQFIGKSRTHGDELIKVLVDRKILGTKKFRGLVYLYPLKKAMVWFHQRKEIQSKKEDKLVEVKGFRPEPSPKLLLNYFSKAEFIIKNGSFGLLDLNSRLQELGYKKMIMDRNLTINSLFKKNGRVEIIATANHYDSYTQDQYYNFFILLWRVVRQFPHELKKRITIVVLLEDESLELEVSKYIELAKKSMYHTYNKSGLQKGEFEVKAITYDVGISRYYQDSALPNNIISEQEERQIREFMKFVPH